MAEESGEYDRYLDRVEKKRKFRIIGSGIAGLATAFEILSAYGSSSDVEIVVYEKNPPDTFYAQGVTAYSAAQAINLPIDHDDYLIPTVLRKSYECFELLSSDPRYGVKLAHAYELTDDRGTGLPPNHNTIMAKLEKSCERLKKPIRLPDVEGNVMEHTHLVKGRAYAINTHKLLKELHKLLEKNGVRFVHQEVTPDQIEDMDGVVVQAAGLNAPIFSQEVFEPEFGMSARITREEVGLEDVSRATMLGAGALAAVRHTDGFVFGGMVLRREPTAYEVKRWIEAVQALMSVGIGYHRPTPDSVRNLLDSDRVMVSRRPVAKRLHRNSGRTHIDDNNARLIHFRPGEHIGVGMAFGEARLRVLPLARKVLGELGLN